MRRDPFLQLHDLELAPTWRGGRVVASRAGQFTELPQQVRDLEPGGQSPQWGIPPLSGAIRSSSFSIWKRRFLSSLWGSGLFFNSSLRGSMGNLPSILVCDTM